MKVTTLITPTTGLRYGPPSTLSLSLLPPLFCRYVSHYIAEAAAEFLGTMILIILGCGVIAQVVVTQSPDVSALPRGVSDPASIPVASIEQYHRRTGFPSTLDGVLVQPLQFGCAAVFQELI
jgi:hypothetical protein